jgi:hypothetical protein
MKRAAALAVVVAAVVLVLVLSGSDHAVRTPARSYAFDSLYEDREGETSAYDAVVARVEHDEETRYRPLQSVPGHNVTRCSAQPPPPSAHRLTCNGTIETHMLYPHYKVILTYRWRAIVELDPNSGARTVRVGELLRNPVKVTP